MSRLSVLQLPKDPAFMRTLRAPAGYQVIGVDFKAAEPSVMAAFSDDRNMMKIYGPGAKPHNIYIFFGTKTAKFGGMLAPLYDAENPTKQQITDVKEKYPETYEVLKTSVLGLFYGMYPKTLVATLAVKGFDITKQDAQLIFNDFWQFFGGLKRLANRLQDEYNKNGYIINGRGRPLGVHHELQNDLLSRFVQSTSHDVLCYMLVILNRLRKERGLDMRPWCVDEHDATYWVCRTEQVEAVKQMFADAFVELNNTLGWSVKFAGDPKVGPDFSMKLGG